MEQIKHQQDTDWMDYANCTSTDPEVFFHEGRGAHVSRGAKEICNNCEVREDCLDYALDNNENYGVWGGLTAEERMKLRRKRIGRRAIGLR